MIGRGGRCIGISCLVEDGNLSDFPELPALNSVWLRGPVFYSRGPNPSFDVNCLSFKIIDVTNIGIKFDSQPHADGNYFQLSYFSIFPSLQILCLVRVFSAAAEGT